MKKLLYTLLAFLMFSVTTVFADSFTIINGLEVDGTAQTYSFTDVHNHVEFGEAISYLKENGIVDGYTDGSFKPDGFINRAEFLKIVSLAKYGENVANNCLNNHSEPTWSYFRFPDVPMDAWYTPYVCVMVTVPDTSAIAGYPDGRFRPDANISFTEAAKILSVLYSDGAVDPENEPEVWYQNYVNYLSQKRAIPRTIHTFGRVITRGDMAEMIYRLRAGITYNQSRTTADIQNESRFSVDNLYAGQKVGFFKVLQVKPFTEDLPISIFNAIVDFDTHFGPVLLTGTYKKYAEDEPFKLGALCLNLDLTSAALIPYMEGRGLREMCFSNEHFVENLLANGGTLQAGASGNIGVYVDKVSIIAAESEVTDLLHADESDYSQVVSLDEGVEAGIPTDGASNDMQEPKTYTNTTFNFSFDFPANTFTEIPSEDAERYIRIQNYDRNVDRLGLDDGEYYMEIRTYDHSKGEYIQDGCIDHVVDAESSGTENVEMRYRGEGKPGGDAGGTRYVLCVEKPAMDLFFMVTEDSGGNIAKEILDSIHFPLYGNVITYGNVDFDFSFALPSAFYNFDIKSTGETNTSEGKKYYFEYENGDIPLYISVFDQNAWNILKTYDGPKPQYLGELNGVVVGYTLGMQDRPQNEEIYQWLLKRDELVNMMRNTFQEGAYVIRGAIGGE